MVNIETTFCGVVFESPFVLSASPCTDNEEMILRAFGAGWAGAVLKTTSMEGTDVSLRYPMMTGLDFDDKKVIGLGNIDLISEHHIDVIEKCVKILKGNFPNKVVIASIMGGKKEDWQTLAKRLADTGVDMIECSFSCPQGSMGSRPGAMVAQDAALSGEVTGWVKEAAGNVPVVIKITPMVTDILEVVRAIKNAGADGICASNTIPALMGIDIGTFIPYPNVYGRTTYSGLSGAAIKPITLKVISEIAKNVDIQITGTGGARTWRDVVEFMLCGARNVQFCTEVMRNGYRIIDDLREGLIDYMEEKGIENVMALIGGSLPFITTHGELPGGIGLVSTADHATCVKDDLCYLACRDGGHQAIELNENRLPIVDEEKCKGCGMCIAVCPVWDCMKLKEKEKPK